MENPSSTLRAVGPESLLKNVVISTYFALASGLLTAAKLFLLRDLAAKPVAILSAVGLAFVLFGALLVIPRRPRSLASAGEGRLPESLIKNVVLAIYFALGAWTLTAGHIFLLFGVAAQSLSKIMIVGAVWILVGVYLILPGKSRSK